MEHFKYAIEQNTTKNFCIKTLSWQLT